MEELTRIWEWLREHGVAVLLIIICSFLAFALLKYLIRLVTKRVQSLDNVKGSDLDRRTETISNVLYSTGVALILGIATLMILTEFGVPVAPVLASVGVASIALGLGAQTLVKDVLNGFFFLVENQYTVGDVIEINGVSGTVEEMNLRITAVRDLNGTFHIIPNGEIRQVANKTRGWSRAVVDVGITYDEDVDTAVQVLREIGTAMTDDAEVQGLLLEDPIVTGIEGLDEWAVRVRIMVKTVPGQHWQVQRYMRHQIRHVFSQKQIKIAFPHQNIVVRR